MKSIYLFSQIKSTSINYASTSFSNWFFPGIKSKLWLFCFIQITGKFMRQKTLENPSKFNKFPNKTWMKFKKKIL